MTGMTSSTGPGDLASAVCRQPLRRLMRAGGHAGHRAAHRAGLPARARRSTTPPPCTATPWSSLQVSPPNARQTCQLSAQLGFLLADPQGDLRSGKTGHRSSLPGVAAAATAGPSGIAIPDSGCPRAAARLKVVAECSPRHADVVMDTAAAPAGAHAGTTLSRPPPAPQQPLRAGHQTWHQPARPELLRAWAPGKASPAPAPAPAVYAGSASTAPNGSPSHTGIDGVSAMARPAPA